MVSYAGRFAPAVAVPLALLRSSEPATELTSDRSYTTSGDATAMSLRWFVSLYRVRSQAEVRPEQTAVKGVMR